MQRLKIRLDRKLQDSQSVAVKTMTIREKVLMRLLGAPLKVSVIVPGNQVSELEINRLEA
ncbi:hypothetical protein [Hutsoniella sourekii]|uniref:hypothetical protein n=1 Tax=Hutsoniella sourekii TaxID=87650 RepID=UPI0004B66EF3|nr:hypothetical protein [Hutsoniella sourekii]